MNGSIALPLRLGLSALLPACALLTLTVGGCAKPLPPEHVEAVAKMQGLGGRIVFSRGGYRLNMGNSRISDEDVGLLHNIQNLKALDLRGTQVTDAAVDELAKIVTLERLEVSGSQISPEGIMQLQTARPELHLE